MPGRGRAAERLDEPVVAAAARDGGLRAERVARELVGGADVVVEAADEPAVHLVGDAERVERRPSPGRSASRQPSQSRSRSRGARVEHRLAALDLAVEDAQRVPLDPVVAVGAELRLAAGEVAPSARRGRRGGRRRRPTELSFSFAATPSRAK